jgi:flagellar biosynthetic protein FlhB
VPIVENPPLARSLYRTVEAGQAIPFELYAVVAGILAYLYRQQVEERARRQAAEAQSKERRAAQQQTTPLRQGKGSKETDGVRESLTVEEQRGRSAAVADSSVEEST